MLEYVKRLLLMQTKLAAQFDAGQTPEIRETALHAEAVQTEDALMDETAAKTQKWKLPSGRSPIRRRNRRWRTSFAS